MRQIGSGLEYKVYDQGNGRVLKIRRSLPNRLMASLRYSVRGGGLAGWPAIVKMQLPITNGVPLLVTRLTETSPETKKLLANIELVGRSDYAQDIVTSLKDYFAEHTLAENLAVAARYVGLVKALWTAGVADPFYNFLFNAGVYPDGSVVQLDVGDMVMSLAFVEDTLRRRVWHLTGMQHIADPELRAACGRLFDEELTPEALLESWPRMAAAS